MTHAADLGLDVIRLSPQRRLSTVRMEVSEAAVDERDQEVGDLILVITT